MSGPIPKKTMFLHLAQLFVSVMPVVNYNNRDFKFLVNLTITILKINGLCYSCFKIGHKKFDEFIPDQIVKALLSF